ncbi:MAG: DegT/DnrJ/EryC1/StrS family aminotransferase [Thermodesulfobacteriota bacterium]
MIGHFRTDTTAADARAVAEVIAGGQLAAGRVVRRFEEETARFLGIADGVAVSSGTSALHLALLALGVGAGDEVLLPSYLCVAPLNAVHHAGAVPVLADVDPETGNLDPQDAEKRLTAKTKAIIVPHLFGRPAPMARLKALGVPVIEDLAQAFGASLDGRPLGGHGEVAVCSFYATKVFTTGEGGMVLSRDRRLLDRVRDLHDYDEKELYQVRYNYKMTDMQGALGLSQLRRLPQSLARRRQIAAFYDDRFRDLGAELPVRLEGENHFRYVLRLHRSPQAFIAAMADRGVTCRRPVFRPLHRLLGLQGFPGSDDLHDRAVSLPIYQGLSDEEVRAVAGAVLAACNGREQ